MRLIEVFRKLTRALIEHRLLLSLGLSAACGLVLHALHPIDEANSILYLIALERPAIYQGLIGSYAVFLYTTPFLVSSILFSLA